MLYFTNNWPPSAVYTGRFMFVAGAVASEAEDRLRRSQERKCPTKSSHSKTDTIQPAYDEEYEHALLYLRSYTGLLLSGLRYVTRSLWMVTRWDILVSNYYELRTLFYVAAYLTHEKAVSSSRLERINSFKKIRECDYEIVKLWFVHGCWWYVIATILLSPLYCLLGLVMGRNPTIIIVELKDGQIVHYNRAVEGVINRVTAGPESMKLSRLQRIIQILLKVIRIEGWIKEDLDIDWRWLQLKMTSELKLWPLFQARIGTAPEYEYLPRDYVAYMNAFLIFVLDWIGGSEVADFVKVLPVIKSIDNCSETRLANWTYNDPVFKQMVNFFYLHGN